MNPVPLNPLGGWSSSLPSPCLSHTHAQKHTLSSPPLLSAISSSTRPGLMLLPGLCDVAIGGPERKPDMGFSAGLVGPEETRSTGGGGGGAAAHVEPASDWVAVNANPAADYRWHGGK